MNSLKEDILVCAHTHMPCAKEFGNKLFVNCGSVGKPKIGRPNPTYCIIDITNSKGVQVKTKEVTYETKKIIKDMTMLDFPHELIRSFETGVE